MLGRERSTIPVELHGVAMVSQRLWHILVLLLFATPANIRAQAWSAGMYLFAGECVRRSEVPEGFFGGGGTRPL